MKIKRKKEVRVSIPTASMSDIAFLLLIFFMVTTVFRRSGGLRVIFPTARATERLGKQRDLSFLWINKDGKIAVDDNVIPDHGKLTLIFKTKIAENPGLITVIKADANVRYKSVNDAIESLRDAGALRVVFATLPEIGE
ncbi:MAG: ExbD/TolR family protein [candidate division WOR-3 bacterium]